MSQFSNVKTCECGCGLPAPLADRTRPERNWIKGKPRPYRQGHHPRANRNEVEQAKTAYEAERLEREIPWGECFCGCRRASEIATVMNPARLIIKGWPRRFIHGHHQNKYKASDPDYLIEDRNHGTPCWIWQKNLSTDGYGITHASDLDIQAHRVYYQLRYGPIPADKQLDHLCRQRACCNPDHVEPVYSIENARRGAATKLTVAEVKEIKAMIRSRAMTRKQMAAHFGVTKSTIDAISCGQNWRDV